MKPLRWGVMGAANIALKKVIPAMQKSSWARIDAIASRDITKSRKAAQALAIERAYGSYDELLADGEIDAVYIPLPNHLHVPWSIKAAQAGKHVLCEKPIGLSAAQARELLPVRDRTGVQMAEAFMVRTHPQWLKVRELVHEGAVGTLRVVSGHFSSYNADPANVRNRLEWGGGGLLDIGCYPVTLARWLFAAEPTHASAVLERDPATGVDRLTAGLLKFNAGQATFTCATQLSPYQRMQIFGTSGHIEVEIPFNAPPDKSCRIFVNDAPMDFPVTDQYTTQADNFARAVSGLEPVAVPLEDAIGNMAVLDALARAGESRRWETV